MKFDTKKMLMAACYAQVQNGAYVKHGEYEKQSNRNIMIDAYNDENFTPSVEVVKLYDDVMHAVNGYMMDLLADTGTMFITELVKMIEKPEIADHELNKMACAPHSMMQFVARKNINKQYSQCSGYVGKEGEKVSLTGKVILVSKIKSHYAEYYIKNETSYLHHVITDDSQCVKFYSKTESTVDSVISFTAKVKRHVRHSLSTTDSIGIDCTMLNYVKIQG